MPYREVAVVDALVDLEDLLSLATTGHLAHADKELVARVIMTQVMPQIKRIISMLEID